MRLEASRSCHLSLEAAPHILVGGLPVLPQVLEEQHELHGGDLSEGIDASVPRLTII